MKTPATAGRHAQRAIEESNSRITDPSAATACYDASNFLGHALYMGKQRPGHFRCLQQWSLNWHAVAVRKRNFSNKTNKVSALVKGTS
eukprot:349715-Chlamydomonas_euryale.AAC.16